MLVKNHRVSCIWIYNCIFQTKSWWYLSNTSNYRVTDRNKMWSFTKSVSANILTVCQEFREKKETAVENFQLNVWIWHNYFLQQLKWHCSGWQSSKIRARKHKAILTVPLCSVCGIHDLSVSSGRGTQYLAVICLSLFFSILLFPLFFSLFLFIFIYFLFFSVSII